jgi:decaprenylphospho-beta-D-erythro-pentofuranosid-2-ulose 2-reductase
VAPALRLTGAGRSGHPSLVSLPWRHALVVGASSGIGEALARQLGAAGCRVALVARRREALERLAGEIGRDRALVFPHDVARGEDARALFPEICRALGGLDLFIYAAGVMPPVAVDEWDFAKDRDIVTVNVLGAMAWIDEAAQRFERGRSGTLVGLSSVAGDRGRRGNPAYHASKAALDTFLESVRNRVGRFGVKVVTVKPGPVDTPMTQGMDRDRLPFLISADEAARQALVAAARGARVAYVPARWRPIMFVLRSIPSAIFQRLDI